MSSHVQRLSLTAAGSRSKERAQAVGGRSAASPEPIGKRLLRKTRRLVESMKLIPLQVPKGERRWAYKGIKVLGIYSKKRL